nr:hypothetical protein [Kofleriaceae bacterium]
MAPACLTPDDTAPEVVSTDRIILNGLPASVLQANEHDLGALGGASLAVAAPKSGLLATADGRTALGYVVACALPASASITLGGASYAGGVGLAPEWATSAPTASNRRWVTACVLARTNLYGVHVEISMRGANPALQPTIAEGLGYLITEGAYYGDLFAPTGPTEYACLGLLKSTGLSLSTLSERACAAPDGNGGDTACGFQFAGACGVLDLGLAPACTSLTAPYGNCRGGSTRYSEVITVDLATL